MQLKDLLRDYRQFHLNGDEMDEADRRDMEERAKVARDTFRAMFRGRLENEGFLVSKGKSSVLRTLTRWAEEERPSAISTRQSGLSATSCSTTLMKLSSEPPGRKEPATWPYIRNTK